MIKHYIILTLLLIGVPIFALMISWQQKFAPQPTNSFNERFPLIVAIQSGSSSNTGVLYYKNVQTLLASGYSINYNIATPYTGSYTGLDNLYSIYFSGEYNDKYLIQSYDFDNGIYSVEGEHNSDYINRGTYEVINGSPVPLSYQHYKGPGMILFYTMFGIPVIVGYYFLMSRFYSFVSPEAKIAVEKFNNIMKWLPRIIGILLVLLFIISMILPFLS